MLSYVKRSLKYCVLFITIFGTPSIYLNLTQLQTNSKDVYQLSSDKLKILLWVTKKTSLNQFHIRDWSLKSCPVQCELTTDKRLINQVDSLIYLGLDFRMNNVQDQKLPEQKKWNQIRVFYNRESPLWNSKNYEKIKFPNNNFNWTMTYRLDSDIYFPYGRVELNKNYTSRSGLKSEEEDELLSNHSIPLSANQLASFKSNFLPPSKKKLIAWTSSRCQSFGKREKLVKKLQKYLPSQVDIYGSCGPLKCPTGRFNHNKVKNSSLKSCYEYHKPNYKFYLSFENSLCHDYVTEKFYYALANNLVPIVYGGADYKLFAPPGSFINARDFKSVKELATYIKFLDEHPEEYLKYFRWTEKYHIAFENDLACTVCQHLQRVSIVIEDEDGGGRKRIIDPNYKSVNADISKWWWHVPKPEAESESVQMSSQSRLACESPPVFS